MNRYRRRDTAPFSSLPVGDPVRVISRHATWLVGTFFGLSVVFWGLAAMAELGQPGTISIYVWGRVITEVILGAAFFLFTFLWRRGKFWGYLRMLMTSCLALVSTLSVVVLAGDYSWWLRAEQAIQAVVVVALLYVLTRSVIRRQFAKKK